MLLSFLLTIYNVILPISLPVLIGASLRRLRGIETKHLSALTLYMLTPALLFDTLVKADISIGEITSTFAFSILHLIAMWAVAGGLGMLLKLSTADRAGLTLVSTFTNSVNYGLPLVLFAFGQLGLDKASVYVIGQIIIVNTIGVFFAARSHFSIKQAFRSVFTLPAIYAAALAMIIRAADLSIPSGLDRGITMIAGAYAPVVLAILGAQMMNAGSSQSIGNDRITIWMGIIVRLLISPLAAWLILEALQVKGILFGVLLILASMPAAVNAVILAEQFDASPKIVSRCILWTTLASFFILPFLIVLIS
jgi:malate permease and related proteins